MTSIYEESHKNLEQLAGWYHDRVADRNEATTRLHLIDHLFMDCLGWTKDDIIAEESQNGQYADYTFMVATRRILIVEAKREGEYFELPAGMNRLEYSLRTIAQDNADLRAALGQVAGYCQSRGVPIGAVSNGHQLVAFIAARSDGIPPFEGRALVFHSLDSMLENFLKLWKFLSKPGMEEGNLQIRLLTDKALEIPARLSSVIPGYPGVKQRNVFQTELQILSELVLEDIARLPELEAKFLAECYCQSGALSQYSLVSRNILQARYAELFDSSSPGPTVVPATEKDGVTSEMLADSISRRPVLIIGDVGVGKTMFIQHQRKVDSAALLKAMVVLYIDLGTQATLTAELREFVLSEIGNQLLSQYHIDIEERNLVRGVYNIDLERFSQGLYFDLREINPPLYRQKEIEFLEERVRDRQQHLQKCINHIVKGRKTPVVIFIDNADQRQYEIQQQAFLISQELAYRWPVTVFVTLRPETFHRSRRTGALSGYHPKAFTISPPRVDLVLEKRLRFAIDITSGSVSSPALEGIRLRLPNLDAVMRAFLDSIRSREELVEFIDNICGGNIRVALDLVKAFFGSGHVDTEKIVGIYSEKGSYIVPLHEFLRAVIFGDSEHYDPSQSILANLFDVVHYDPKEHFLMPILLGVLAAGTNQGTGTGFIETARLYEYLQGLGFIPEQVDATISRAFGHSLIEATARLKHETDQPLPSALRATTVGVYHVTSLCRLFAYIDAIIVDTPIFDTSVRQQVQDVRRIDERLDRAATFCRYLDEEWKPLDGKGTRFLWPDVSLALKRQIRGIRNRAERSREGQAW